MTLSKYVIILACLSLIGCGAVEFKETYNQTLPTKINGKSYSLESIKNAIKAACAERGWVSNFIKDGTFTASIDLRGHYAKVKITYTTQHLEVKYLESKNLGAEGVGNNIHKNYERWVNNLKHSIVLQLKNQ